MKLRKILEESKLAPEQKKTFLEAMSKFNEYGKHIYRESELKSIIENMETLMSGASNFIIDESDDWFDLFFDFLFLHKTENLIES